MWPYSLLFTGISQIGSINIFLAPGHAVAKETAGSCSLCRPGRGGVRATKAEVPKRSAGEVLDSYIRVQSSEEKNAVFSSKFQEDSQCWTRGDKIAEWQILRVQQQLAVCCVLFLPYLSPLNGGGDVSLHGQSERIQPLHYSGVLMHQYIQDEWQCWTSNCGISWVATRSFLQTKQVLFCFSIGVDMDLSRTFTMMFVQFRSKFVKFAIFTWFSPLFSKSRPSVLKIWWCWRTRWWIWRWDDEFECKWHPMTFVRAHVLPGLHESPSKPLYQQTDGRIPPQFLDIEKTPRGLFGRHAFTLYIGLPSLHLTEAYLVQTKAYCILVKRAMVGTKSC